MLKIVFGDTDNSIYHPPTYFDNTYEDEWITYPRSVKMIKDIDKSDIAGARSNRQSCSRLNFSQGTVRRSKNADTHAFR